MCCLRSSLDTSNSCAACSVHRRQPDMDRFLLGTTIHATVRIVCCTDARCLQQQSLQPCDLCDHRCHMPLYATNSKAHAMSWPLEFSCATCDTKRTHLRLQLMLRLSTSDTYTGSLRAVQSCRQKEGATIITHTADESSNAILGLKCISLPASCIESLVQQNRQITVQWHWRRTPPAKHRRAQPHPG